MLSFSAEEFMLVLEQYNTSIWPMQIVAYLLVILVLFFSFKSSKYSQKIISVILSFLWLFNGVVFSLIYWAPSHLFGYVFGICCIVQGFLFDYRNHIGTLCCRGLSGIWLLFGTYIS
jgi:FtsH-binding integral membrane protein